MIDIENIVISEVAKAVRAAFLADHPGLVVYGYEQALPESFPCVTVFMSDNYTHRQSQEFGKLRENHANVAFTVNVFTNNTNGKKELAKAIYNVVDETLQDLKLTRIIAAPTPNIDRTIYRITGRYTGIVADGITKDNDGTETTTYVMFRN